MNCKKNSPIMVLCPMECEYSILKSKIENPAANFFGYFEFTEGCIDGYPVVAVKCLAGMVNSGSAALHFIEKYHPLCVIIQGTAGAHNPDLKVNDIIIGETILESGTYFAAHRDFGGGICTEDWIFPGVEILDKDRNVRRVQKYHSTEKLMKIAQSVPYQNGNVRRGCLYSADAWNREIDRIDFFFRTLHTDCEEMETFAVAQICEMLGVDYLGIRVISNSEYIPDCKFSKESARFCQLYCFDVLKAIIAEERN